ncbi:MAG: nucleotide exchange factor GrpE [Rickettsiales bacterium]|nr:nucleotide exchange factor GrpE [Rickettsiales bacterium]
MNTHPHPDTLHSDSHVSPSAEEMLERALQQASEAMAASAPDDGVLPPPETIGIVPAADEELKAQNAEMKDQVLRTMAEMENVRARARRDVEESSKYAVSGFARDVISVLDNLYRAAASVPPEARQESALLNNLGQGIDMTLSDFLGVIQRHGIKRIDPMGQPFDHNFHQAVVQIDSDSHEPGTILQVLQAGYVLHDRLLRPAMVGVSKAPSQAADAPQQLDTRA